MKKTYHKKAKTKRKQIVYAILLIIIILSFIFSSVVPLWAATVKLAYTVTPSIVVNDTAARNVARDSDITFSFNKDINPIDVTDAEYDRGLDTKIKVYGINQNDLIKYYDIQVNSNTIVFKHKDAENLQSNTWYRIHISKSLVVGNDDGQSLDSDIDYMFVTGADSSKPYVYSTNLNSYFDVNGSIYVYFNKDMKKSFYVNSTSGIHLNEYNFNSSSNKMDLQQNIPVNISWTDNRTLLIKPVTQLKNLNNYSLYIPKNSVKDLNGNYNDDYSVNFTTVYKSWDGVNLTPSIKTDTGINLTENNVNGVLPQSSINISFSKEMTLGNDRSLNEIELRNIDNGKSDVVDKTVTYTNNIVTIVPKNPYLSDNSYMLTIPSGLLRDRCGNNYGGGVFYFKTVADGNINSIEVYSINPGSITRKYDSGTMITVYGRNFSKDLKASITDQYNTTVLDSTYMSTNVVDSRTARITLPDTSVFDTTGSYKICLQSVSQSVYSPVFQLIDMDKPDVADMNVLRSNIDEQAISTMNINGQTVQVLQIYLSGKYTQLTDINSLGLITLKKTNGSDKNYIDVSKINDVFNIKDVTQQQNEINKLYDAKNKIIYLPITQLESGYQYTVTIPAGILRNDNIYNTEIDKNFTTMPVPIISSVDKASDVQNYISGSYIKIVGSNFVNPYIKLSKDTDTIIYPDYSRSSSNTLIAYLPQNPQLGVGNYRITVYNDYHHSAQKVDGFGIVALKQDGSNFNGYYGSINKSNGEIRLDIDTNFIKSGLLSINLNETLGNTKKWTLEVPAQNTDVFNKSTLSANDFDLNISSFVNGTIISKNKSISICVSNGGKQLPKGKKLCSKIINVIVDKNASVIGSIDIKYFGSYNKSMGLYYFDVNSGVWKKLSLVSNGIDRINRTIKATLNSKLIKGNMYFAVLANR